MAIQRRRVRGRLPANIGRRMARLPATFCARREPAVSAPNLKTIIELGGNAAPFVSVFAFICSILFNQAIFHSWGISFLSVASPSDVLMTGIVGLSAAVLFVVITGGALLYSYLLVFLANAAERLTRKLTRSSKLGFLASCLAGPAVIAPSYVIADTILSETGAFTGAHNYVGAGFAFALLYIYAPTFAPTWRPFFTRSWGNWLVRGLTVWAFIVFACNTYLIVRHEIEHKSGDGFVQGHYALDPVPADCDLPDLLWIGERATIFRCVDGKIKLSFKADDLSLTPESDDEWYSQFAETSVGATAASVSSKAFAAKGVGVEKSEEPPSVSAKTPKESATTKP